jgi:hypothetical protein
MSLEQQTQAVRNNAVWCDTVFRSHGRPGAFRDHIWLNRQPAPPFYPNAVTLTRDGQGAQLAAVEEIAAARAGGWGVKDSFCCLDLTPFGCALLFEADWIYRPAALPKPQTDCADVRWLKVETSSALVAWERAWQGGGEDQGSAERIFLPPLLADPAVAVLAAYQEERIIAGVIANRTGEVVGLSNLFTPADDAERFWASCVASVMDAFPGLPVVGYEADEALSLAETVGFTRIGPLRIWVKENNAA